MNKCCNMKRGISFLFMAWISLSALKAQSPFQHPSAHYRLGMYGTLIYPGFQGGVEWPSKAITIYKHRKKKVKLYQKERYWGAQAGMYTQKYVHQQWYLGGSRSLRKVRSNQRYTEWVFGLGLSRSWLNGSVYEVDGNGTVNALRMQGNWHGMFSTSWYMGWDKPQTLKPYIGIGQMSFLGNNGMPVIRPLLELGLRWKANHIPERSIETRDRHKGRGYRFGKE